MGAMAVVPVLTRLEQVFYCRSRRGGLTLDMCLDGYLQANAMEKRRSACFRCPQGRRHRDGYADNGSAADPAESTAGRSF